MTTDGTDQADGSSRHPVLAKDEIAAIAAALSAGQALDPRYKPLLFPDTNEARLAYNQKSSPGVILSDTMSMPLQVNKRIGDLGAEWNNKLIFGDNIQVLKRLLDLKNKGQLTNADHSRGVRLCYIDPPFATKREFRGRRGALAYRDRVDGAEFVEYLRKRLVLIHELLADDGALYLHLDTNKVHYLKVVLDEIFGSNRMFGEIIWKRTFGHGDAQRWAPVHETILAYSKGDDYVWNTPRVAHNQGYEETKYTQDDGDGRKYQLTAIDSPNARLNLTYAWNGYAPPEKGWRYSKSTLDELDAEGRIYKPTDKTKRPRLKRYLDENAGRVVDDVWTDIPPVNSQAADRNGYPTQKPVALLERIINASTSAGDLVLDCFSGSGTTPVAAHSLGRRWIGVDSGKLAIYTTQRRLLSAEQPAAFEVCQAGLYDNALLELLPFDDFRDFTLDLFGCRNEPFRISGVPMAGTRRGDPVHVFPFHQTNGALDEGYLDSLHKRLRGKVDKAVYVIVPDSRCDPGLFEDVVSFGGTTYFLLRVPYSVIEVLHDRDFKQISQPAALAEVNDALESFGFDFVELPETSLTIDASENGTRVSIESFYRGGLDPELGAERDDAGRGDLAMIFVDTDYDGTEFRLQEHLFGDDLKGLDWRFEITHAPTASIMLVLIDVLGNELRRVLAPEGASTRGPAVSAINAAVRSAPSNASSPATNTKGAPAAQTKAPSLATPSAKNPRRK